jgi:polyphosphate glucokinase
METPKPISALPRALRRSQKKAPRTLCVDIGGTGIKAVLLDERGRPLTDRARIPDPEGRDAAPGNRDHSQTGGR